MRANWRGIALAFQAVVLALMFICFLPSQASAQVVHQYTDFPASPVAIPDNTSCASASSVKRTFTVGSFTVGDVNIGILLDHTYRGDLQIQLRSPAGTTVNVMTNVGGNADNLNILFDDEATGGTIAAHTATPDPLTPAPPPYNKNKTPTSSLASFDGQNAAGTWTLTLCDTVGTDTGSFRRADLYITEPPPFADLSLDKTVSAGGGSSAIYTLALTNASASTLTATGVTVTDNLPAGVTFVSTSGTGTYSSGTGIWTVGAITPGQSLSIAITVNVTAASGTLITNVAQVGASSAYDYDSTPNNGITSEDDYDSVSFTVGGRLPGLAPNIYAICTSGTQLFDWDDPSITWAPGSLNNSYTVANLGSVNFAVATTATFFNNATYGGQNPAISSGITGGFNIPVQQSLTQYVDFNNVSEVVTTTVTLPNAVPGLQFRVMDVDYNAGQFSDRITVTGTYNGTSVTPTLANGVSNYVIGNSAYGDTTADNATADGTVVVTFSAPVDKVVIQYGNHSNAPAAAPANPGGQAASIHDITFCKPVANISVTKISNVISDGVSASNPKSIPGAVVRYCILVSNAGSASATSVSAADPLPSAVTYIAGTMLSGTNCASALTPEDDDNSGADESDPIGMSISGTTITGVTPTLAPAGSMALVFNATLN